MDETEETPLAAAAGGASIANLRIDGAVFNLNTDFWTMTKVSADVFAK